jgi:multiple sugar transport system ATP-binding protein
MAEVRLEQITRRFGSLTALDNVSLTFADGKLTSLFGPPGSGKSVLLRILLGLDQPDDGRILIDGRDVTHAAPAERNLAMVFQNLALFPQLSARDNILFPLRRRGVPQSQTDDRLDRVAAVLGIAHILHKKPAHLSGGERQRVAMGRALVRDAGAWLMDEPIAALDARMRDAARIELKRLQQDEGRTFIYVTHDCDEAMSVADRMVILNEGRIAQIGTPEEVYTNPASRTVAELVGTPRINLLDTVADGPTAATPFGQVRLPAAQRGPITLALRPEALRLATDAPLRAEVADIERLGGHAIVALTAGGTRLRMIADGPVTLRIGDVVGFDADPTAMHVFDAASGDRLEQRKLAE